MVHYWGSGDYCFKVTATGEYGTLKCRTCIYCLLKFNIRNCLMEKKWKRRHRFRFILKRIPFLAWGIWGHWFRHLFAQRWFFEGTLITKENQAHTNWLVMMVKLLIVSIQQGQTRKIFQRNQTQYQREMQLLFSRICSVVHNQ